MFYLMETNSGFKVSDTFNKLIDNTVSHDIVPYGCLTFSIINSDIDRIHDFLVKINDDYRWLTQPKKSSDKLDMTINTFSTPENNETNHNIFNDFFVFDDGDNSNDEITFYKKVLIPTKEVTDIHLGFIINLLISDFNKLIKKYKDCSENVFDYESPFPQEVYSFFKDMKCFVKNIRKMYLSNNDEWVLNFSNLLLNSVTLQTSKYVDEHNEIHTIYHINSVAELFLADFCEYKRNNTKTAKACKMCGKLFFCDNGKQKYCTYNDKICSKTAKNPPADTLEGMYNSALKKQRNAYNDALNHVITNEYREVGITLETSDYLYNGEELEKLYNEWKKTLKEMYDKLLQNQDELSINEFKNFISNTRFTVEYLKKYRIPRQRDTSI